MGANVFTVFGLTFLAVLIAGGGAIAIITPETLTTLGRVRQMKKYRFHQVIDGKIAPVILAETDRFRDVEKLRNQFSGTVAIVYEQTPEEVAHAA